MCIENPVKHLTQMEFLLKKLNRFQQSIIFAKDSILDIWPGFKYASVEAILF